MRGGITKFVAFFFIGHPQKNWVDSRIFRYGYRHTEAFVGAAVQPSGIKNIIANLNNDDKFPARRLYVLKGK